MKIANQICSLALLITFISIADAQSPEEMDVVREEFHGTTELPDGVAFINTLRMIDHLNKRDPEAATYYVLDGMDFAKLSSARKFKNQLLKTFRTIDSEIIIEKKRLGCAFGVPNAVGNHTYSVLEAMDDTPEVVAAQHLDVLKNDLDEDTTTRLQGWLETQKPKISQVKYKYAEYYEHQSENADAKLAEICNSLNKGAK